jgi:hypothetical protein
MAESTTNQPLSKSQKKRMKRNKNKAKTTGTNNAAGDEASVASSVQSGPGHANPNENVAVNNTGVTTAAQVASQLNPIDKMRSDILKKGFTFEEVEGVMNEMWEKELAYDEYDAVLSFLEAKASANDGSSGMEASIDLKVNGGKSNSFSMEWDSAPMAMTASEDTASPESIQKGSSPPETAPTPEKSYQLVKEADEIPFTGATVGISKTTLPVRAVVIDLALKLELVAKHENIHDSAYAITEWATKVAKQEEVSPLIGKEKLPRSIFHPCLNLLTSVQILVISFNRQLQFARNIKSFPVCCKESSWNAQNQISSRYCRIF